MLVATLILLFASTTPITLPMHGSSRLGYYYVNYYFGSQRSEQSVIVDTGSYKTVIDCDKCANCGEHLHPSFNRQASTTCTAPDPHSGYECTDCEFYSGYAEGSSYSGKYVQDIVSIGDRSVNMVFGCVSSETGLFVSQQADGITGVGPTHVFSIENNPPTPDVALFNQHVIDKDIVSLCIGNEGGQLAFGEQNSNLIEAGALPLIVPAGEDNWKYNYDVHIDSIHIDGIQVASNIRTFVDSGTTFTYFTDSVYQAIVDKFNSHCSASADNCSSTTEYKPCYEKGWATSEKEFYASFPTLTFVFGNSGSFDWRPEAYFIQTQGEYCVGIEKGSNTLGATFMKNHDFSFDKQNKKITITKASCGAQSSFSHRMHAVNSYNKHLHEIVGINARHRWVPYTGNKEYRLCYALAGASIICLGLLWLVTKRGKTNGYTEMKEDLEEQV